MAVTIFLPKKYGPALKIRKVSSLLPLCTQASAHMLLVTPIDRAGLLLPRVHTPALQNEEIFRGFSEFCQRCFNFRDYLI